MIALTKYKIAISVIEILNHLWLFRVVPEWATHRLFMCGMIKGKQYDWKADFNEQEIGVQEVLKLGCEAFKKADK